MNTPTHTPGPWKRDNRDYKTTISGAGLHLATLHRDGGGSPAQIHPAEFETLANARLIAAAPDLLAALQELLAMPAHETAPNRAGWAWHRAAQAVAAATSRPLNSPPLNSPPHEPAS